MRGSTNSEQASVTRSLAVKSVAQVAERVEKYVIPDTCVALISLIFYISAVLATNLFGSVFQEWFGTIGASMYSLFQIMTLESWSMGIVRPVMKVYPYAWMFFVPFIMVTSFAVINLFIGVIVDAMQRVQEELVEEIHADARNIEKKLDNVEEELADLRRMLRERR